MTNYASPSATVRNRFFAPRTPQVHPMGAEVKDAGSSGEPGPVEIFHRNAAERLRSLLDETDFLSLSWLTNAMDLSLDIESEFKELGILRNPRSSLARAVADFMDRGLKALDICNAIRDGIDQVRRWQKHVEIVLSALDAENRCLAESNLRRARKALVDLAVSISADDKEFPVLAAHRSFAGVRGLGSSSTSNSLPHFRSLSWSVSRSWSAGRQLQAMSSNLNSPPRGSETLVLALYTMNNIILFSCAILVAAIPCQDRGFQAHFGPPRVFPWAGPLLSIHEKIIEASTKRERRGNAGLLKEIFHISASVRRLLYLTEASHVSFPLSGEVEKSIGTEVAEIRKQWCLLKEGLDPLERQVRELFLRIASSRTEALDSTNRHANNR